MISTRSGLPLTYRSISRASRFPCIPEVGARDLEPPVVDLLLDLDLVELDLLGVECLDDVAEVGVEPLDLGQDLPSLCLLLVDLKNRRLRQRQHRQREQQEDGEVSFSRSDT